MNRITCLVITFACANAEALWAIMDCILSLCCLCVFDVILGGKCERRISIKNPKLLSSFFLLCFREERTREVGAGSIYILIVALRRRRRRRRRVLQSVCCVLIYIYIFISFLISYKQHPSVFSFSFVYFYPSFLFCCVGYVLLIKSFLSSSSLSLSLFHFVIEFSLSAAHELGRLD